MSLTRATSPVLPSTSPGDAGSGNDALVVVDDVVVVEGLSGGHIGLPGWQEVSEPIARVVSSLTVLSMLAFRVLQVERGRVVDPLLRSVRCVWAMAGPT